ncbi:hypothetical protein BU17DRAFT_52557 [Hysterangium stoloniferum]|nr:hypothetical protein BU17DRAFT_52557 [Hysterangium stoloniferum]
MPINPDLATLIGFACECVLYGLYSVLFVLSLVFLVWRRRSRNLDAPLVGATCLLFTLCTTHWIIQFVHFVNYMKAGSIQGFSKETVALGVGDFILSVADFVGDAVLIHRCFVVWGNNYWIIIFPSLTALGGFVSGMFILHLVIKSGLGHQVAPTALVKVGTAVLTLPLCTNVMITGLIVGRLLYMGWSTQSQFSEESRTSQSNGKNTVFLIWRVCNIFIESGMIYLAAQLILVVLFASKNPAAKVVGYPIVQIYGIAPTLILCRVGMGISAEKTQFTTNADVPSFRLHSKQQQSAFGRSAYSGDTVTTGGGTHSAVIPQIDRGIIINIDEGFQMHNKKIPSEHSAYGESNTGLAL